MCSMRLRFARIVNRHQMSCDQWRMRSTHAKPSILLCLADVLSWWLRWEQWCGKQVGQDTVQKAQTRGAHTQVDAGSTEAQVLSALRGGVLEVKVHRESLNSPTPTARSAIGVSSIEAYTLVYQMLRPQVDHAAYTHLPAPLPALSRQPVVQA